LDITSFSQNGTTIFANGTLSGTIRNAAGKVVGAVEDQAVSIHVTIDPTCTVLTLTLGPLDLSLLGLMVHLN
jgi:hypothetical protein